MKKRKIKRETAAIRIELKYRNFAKCQAAIQGVTMGKIIEELIEKEFKGKENFPVIDW